MWRQAGLALPKTLGGDYEKCRFSQIRAKISMDSTFRYMELPALPKDMCLWREVNEWHETALPNSEGNAKGVENRRLYIYPKG